MENQEKSSHRNMEMKVISYGDTKWNEKIRLGEFEKWLRPVFMELRLRGDCSCLLCSILGAIIRVLEERGIQPTGGQNG